MKGIWQGFYKYKKEYIQKAIGFEKTKFTITIVSFDGQNFKGIVIDDVATGGMNEEGEVIGFINGDKISFKKIMPKKTLLLDLKGTRKTLNKKHPTIYYSGTLINDKKQASGIWKFKTKVFLILGFIPFPHRISGTWSMNLLEQ